MTKLRIFIKKGDNSINSKGKDKECVCNFNKSRLHTARGTVNGKAEVAIRDTECIECRVCYSAQFGFKESVTSSKESRRK